MVTIALRRSASRTRYVKLGSGVAELPPDEQNTGVTQTSPATELFVLDVVT